MGDFSKEENNKMQNKKPLQIKKETLKVLEQARRNTFTNPEIEEVEEYMEKK